MTSTSSRADRKLKRAAVVAPPMAPWQKETLVQIRGQAPEASVAEFLASGFEGEERLQRRVAVLKDALREMVADPLGPSPAQWGS